MRLLLDTHIFIWVVTDDKKLKSQARKHLREASEVYVSAVSIWEIAIKSGLGRLQGDPQDFVQAINDSGFSELPVWSRHAAMVARLPNHHNDPFDRLLLAQAMAEPLRLLTADASLAQYSELVQLA